jgi:hypothetical protein
MPAKPTKIEIVLKQLHRPSGASIAQLQKATGWQPHSVRAVLTGLRKKGHNVERGISRQLMIRAIAYELQAKTFGGLKPAVVRQLQKIAAGLVTGAPVAIKTAFKLKPGARLVREWNGITHVVEVVDDGFIWNGERHLSLSAIARTITGARWSGPRFFGLPSGGVP